MKTIIFFASKYGAAQEIAHRITKGIDGAIIHDLKQTGVPDPAGFDCVIIGSSVYVGSIRKETKTFLTQYSDVLCRKRMGLFLSGLEANGEKENFERNFSPAILQAAKVASFLGGILDPKKCSLYERLIMKVVVKQPGYVNTIDDSKIEAFVKALKS